MRLSRKAQEAIESEPLPDEAYERVKSELDAFTGKLVAINFDVSSAVATALGALPKLKTLRPQIEKDLPHFDLRSFDGLEDYALALEHAQSLFAMASRSSDALKSLMAEGLELRATLLSDITTLGRRGFIPPVVLKRLKGPNGYLNVAEDLSVLSSLLRDSWPRIEGKCGTTLAELVHAEKLGARIMRELGRRQFRPAELAAATERRLRAFTVFFRTYEQARRAAEYLRFSEDDANRIAPSLYGRRVRKKKPEPTATPATNSAHEDEGTPAPVTANL